MGIRYGGRQKGTPNKATTEARQAIADFVEGNSHRLVDWLDQVADGITKTVVDKETGEEREEYIVPPNPSKAFDMFQSVVEYHIPKLARMEVAGDRDNPLVVDNHHDVFGELLKNLKMQRQSD